MEHRRYLRPEDFNEVFYSHQFEATEVMARLRTFPEGLDAAEVATRSLGAASEPFPVPRVHGEHAMAQVRRAGFHEPLRVPWRDVVDGDIVVLRTGDAVLADVRLLSTRDNVPLVARGPWPCWLWQFLTLALPRQLCAAPAPPGTPWHDAKNVLFSGDVVLRGAATAVVVHTGKLSAAYLMQSFSEVESPSGRYMRSEGVSVNVTGDVGERLRALERVVLHWRSPLLARFREGARPQPDATGAYRSASSIDRALPHVAQSLQSSNFSLTIDGTQTPTASPS